MRRASFADVALDEGAAALNCVFQNYLIPMTFSAEQLRLHIAYNDVDTARSPIWYDDNGAVLAAAMMGVRRRRGWIGGFGVSPEHRGHGHARALAAALIEAAREGGLESITLEVLAENVAAIRVYEESGFAIRRRLRSFEIRIEDDPVPPEFATVEPRDLMDEPDSAPASWQRERATLLNGAVSSAVTDGAGTYALFRRSADTVQVLKLQARDEERLTALTRAVAQGRQYQRILVLNEPEESPLTALARDAGWSNVFVQFEMMVSL